MFAYKVIKHKRYKYELERSYYHDLEHYEPKTTAQIPGAVRLDHGLLFIRCGYMWDGATGPALDTTSIIRASMIHDALYQLIGAGKIPKRPWKKYADKELRRVCKEDGMNWFRRQRVYWAVRLFGPARGVYDP